MNADRTTHETLVGRMLAEHDKRTATSIATHPEDDALALFAEGRLREPELGQVIRHLADCGDCRSKAGMLMIAAGEEAELTELPSRTIPWHRRPAMQLLALAAGLLICVTGFFAVRQRNQQFAENAAYQSAEKLLNEGRFDDALAKVDTARQDQVTSPRLDNLAAQALRRISTTVALGSAGKLTDLGIGIGGIVAREPTSNLPAADAERAKQLLDAAAESDLQAALNRGHLLLQQNEPAQALNQFQTLVEKHPDEPLAWIGLGNAQYLLDDFRSAAASFEHGLNLSPGSATAAMNLAMTYDELREPQKAIVAWKDLLAVSSKSLSADERSQIEAHLRELETPQK
jgi:tetratricopeptide (TPR) repeat protein